MPGNKWDDHYARRAREEKWRARSVYKLQEIDAKFHLIRRGQRVLDLGCYPGSWSQYGLNVVGRDGLVVGVDLIRPDDLPYENFRFVQADVLTFDIAGLLGAAGPMDVVMSDMAPGTSGARDVDAERSMELARRALDIAERLLQPSGNFLCKILEGEDLKPFRNRMAGCFKRVKPFRPAAIRKRSREVYMVGLDFVGETAPRR
jgi:23S rRNA (uridine2552-2'-O)-methyltransferase